MSPNRALGLFVVVAVLVILLARVYLDTQDSAKITDTKPEIKSILGYQLKAVEIRVVVERGEVERNLIRLAAAEIHEGFDLVVATSVKNDQEIMVAALSQSLAERTGLSDTVISQVFVALNYQIEISLSDQQGIKLFRVKKIKV